MDGDFYTSDDCGTGVIGSDSFPRDDCVASTTDDESETFRERFVGACRSDAASDYTRTPFTALVYNETTCADPPVFLDEIVLPKTCIAAETAVLFGAGNYSAYAACVNDTHVEYTRFAEADSCDTDMGTVTVNTLTDGCGELGDNYFRLDCSTEVYCLDKDDAEDLTDVDSPAAAPAASGLAVLASLAVATAALSVLA